MKRFSIRTRLMLLLIILTTLPIGTVTWIATLNTRRSVEEKMIDANLSRMLWADQYLNELIQQISTLFYTLQINQQLMSGLNELDNPNPSVQFRTQGYLRETMTYYFHANSRLIDNMTLYSHSNQMAFMVNFSVNGLIYGLEIEKGAWQRLPSATGPLYFSQNHDGTYAYHRISRFEDRALLGGMAVRINKEVWDQVITILQSEPESSIYVLNDKGELQSGSSPELIPAETAAWLRSVSASGEPSPGMHKADGRLLFAKTISDGKLILVKSVPLATVLRSADPTIRAGLWTGFLFAAASVLLSIVFSLRITRPIVGLAKTMRWATLTNYEPKSPPRDDEIGLLERGFHAMMQRNKDLIEGEYRREIALKNAQLLALQAQINPHFLNNTLHMIGGMALLKNAPEIYDTTRVIGDLLRYSISSEGEMVALEEEIRHTKNYLFIQEQRYAGRCRITMTVDPRVCRTRVPKLILQPIVENAFEHGLQKKSGAWELVIRCLKIGGRVILLVKDGGVGMEEGCLVRLRQDLKDGGQGDPVSKGGAVRRRGIGLHNVHARLKLQFGDRYGVRLFSRSGAGAVIVLVLPAGWEEDNGHV